MNLVRLQVQTLDAALSKQQFLGLYVPLGQQ